MKLTNLTAPSTPTNPVKSSASAGNKFHYRLFSPKNQAFEMPSVWQLVAGNLAASGDVSRAKALLTAKDNQFDQHINTRVVSIHHESGQLAGTVSLTIDSNQTMPVFRHFQSQLEPIRSQQRLLNPWRLSVAPKFQCMEIRQRTLSFVKQYAIVNDIDAIVLYFNERLRGYYKRLYNGRVIATTQLSFDGVTTLPVCLMVCDMKDNAPNPKHLHGGDFHEHAMDL